MFTITRVVTKIMEINEARICKNHMAVCQNLVPLVNIKIAGKWMFIPLKMVLIGIDPYPYRTMFWPAKPFISRISKLGQRLAMLTIAAVVGGLFCQKQVFCEDGALFCMHPP